MIENKNYCVMEFLCSCNPFEKGCRHYEGEIGAGGYQRCKFYRCRFCESPSAIKESLEAMK